MFFKRCWCFALPPRRYRLQRLLREPFRSREHRPPKGGILTMLQSFFDCLVYHVPNKSETMIDIVVGESYDSCFDLIERQRTYAVIFHCIGI